MVERRHGAALVDTDDAVDDVVEDGLDVLGLFLLGGFTPLARADVADNLGGADDMVVLVQDRRNRCRNIDQRAILALADRLQMAHLRPVGDFLQYHRFFIVATRGHQHQHGLAYRFGRRVAVHLLGSRIPTGDDAVQCLADDGVLRGLDDGVVASKCSLKTTALGNVFGNAEIAADSARIGAHGGHHQRYRKVMAVLMDIGPLASFRTMTFGHFDKHPEAVHGAAQFRAELRSTRYDFVDPMRDRWRLLADHLLGRVPEHLLGSMVENGDQSLRIGGDDRHLGCRIEHVSEKFLCLTLLQLPNYLPAQGR